MRRNATLLSAMLVLANWAGSLALAQIQAMPPSGSVFALPSTTEDSPRGRLLGTPTTTQADYNQIEPFGQQPVFDNGIAPAEPIGEPIYRENLSDAAPFGQTSPVFGLPIDGDTPWNWQLLPAGIIYKSYLASTTEPRLASGWSNLRGTGWIWNATLGARAGIIRYGTENENWPEGWQLDLEGAALPRLNAFESRDLLAADYRVGVPLTFRRGPWEGKFGYYHLSSHIGDEYLLTHPTFPRINYVRENLLFGLALRPRPDWRFYAEVAYAVWIDGGAKPWEFQFGAEFSPAMPTTKWGAPFGAVNGHLNQAVDFSGNVNFQLGWAWRGETGHLFRIGGEYFNGMSDQGQFFRQFEDRAGFALWYDF